MDRIDTGLRQGVVRFEDCQDEVGIMDRIDTGLRPPPAVSPPDPVRVPSESWTGLIRD
ncbi:MAG: hypothetical protein GY737_10505 [Desulfobacteraceae bacterium]|nr:hypothetical protein [Desulfobacteraceae bacterium]